MWSVYWTNIKDGSTYLQLFNSYKMNVLNEGRIVRLVVMKDLLIYVLGKHTYFHSFYLQKILGDKHFYVDDKVKKFCKKTVKVTYLFVHTFILLAYKYFYLNTINILMYWINMYNWGTLQGTQIFVSDILNELNILNLIKH